MNISEIQLHNLITAIHKTSPMVVMELAGAGTQSLAWLHSVGGSSNTILEAIDRYSAASLRELLDFEPEQFVSPTVAQAMADKAYLRACHLAPLETPVAGIGCTATIATDRPKKGRPRGFIALREAQHLTWWELSLEKGDRTHQETLISHLLLIAVARACNLEPLPLDLKNSECLEESTQSIDLVAQLLGGEFPWLRIDPEGKMKPGYSWSHIAFLSGAFNPLHAGHREIVDVAAEYLKQDIYFELPLINADKAPLDLAETHRRIQQFAGWSTVILTRASLFREKAELFPNSVFIVGIDTVVRLIQPRFYDHDAAKMERAFEIIKNAGCRFLVVGRLQGDIFLTLDDIILPKSGHDLFEQIPEERFRRDISSTAIRERNEKKE